MHRGTISGQNVRVKIIFSANRCGEKRPNYLCYASEMSIPVYIVNSGGGASYDCPYKHRGCPNSISYLDQLGHLKTCNYNDGSVNLDAYFQDQVAKRNASSVHFSQAQQEFHEREIKYTGRSSEMPSSIRSREESLKNPKFDSVTGKRIRRPSRMLWVIGACIVIWYFRGEVIRLVFGVLNQLR